MSKIRPIAGTTESDAYYMILFEGQLVPVTGKPFWVEVCSTRPTLYEQLLLLRHCQDRTE